MKKLLLLSSIMFFLVIGLVMASDFPNENTIYDYEFDNQADFVNNWGAGGCPTSGASYWHGRPKLVWNVTNSVNTTGTTERWSHFNLTTPLPLSLGGWEIKMFYSGGASPTWNEWDGYFFTNGSHGVFASINRGAAYQNLIQSYDAIDSSTADLVREGPLTTSGTYAYMGQWSNKTFYFLDNSRTIIQTNVSSFIIDKISCVSLGRRYAGGIFSYNISTYNFTADSLVVNNSFPVDKYNTNQPDINFNFTVYSNSTYSCDLKINGSVNQTLTPLLCFQETANVSTECGGLDTGIYDPGGYAGGNPFELFWDGNYTTFIDAGSYTGYINYTIPRSLYKNASGAIWTIAEAPTPINLTIPSSCFDYYHNTLSLSFSQAFSGTQSLWHCWDGSWNLLLSKASAQIYEESIWWNISAPYIDNRSFEQTFDEGIYNWQIECTNPFEIASTPLKTFNVDTTDPVITTGFVNESTYYKNNITGQFNFTDNIVLYSYNVSIDNIQVSNKSDISANFFQYNLSYNVTGLSGTIHNLFIRLADGHTAKELKNESDWRIERPLLRESLTFNWEGDYNEGYVKIQKQNPSLLDSWDYEKKKDRYEFEFNPSSQSDSYTFEVESSFPMVIMNVPDSKYKKWIIVDDHWLDFYVEGQEQDVEIIEDKGKVIVTVSNLDAKLKEIKFNSVGDLNIITQNYTFYTIDVADTFERVIFTNVSTDLDLVFNGINTTNGPVILEWNETNYTSSLVTQNATSGTYRVSILDTTFISNERYINHTWFFNLTTNESTNGTEQLQYRVIIDACRVGNNLTYPMLNISYFDEINNTPITVTNNYNLDWYDGNFNTNLQGTFVGNNTDSFCTNLDPSNVTYNWDYWNTITLTKSGYVSKILDIEAAFPQSASNNPTTNLSLFMINISESTTVTFTWLTNSFEVIDGTMLIYRCNIDGTRSLIESTPIIGGQSVANLELLTGVYSYEVIYNGIKYTSPEGYTKCHTESTTTRQFFVDTGVITITDQLGLNNAGCTLTKIGNDTVNMSWGLNDEDTTTIIQGCISAYRQSSLGSQLIFENCSSSTVQQFSLVNSIPLNSFTYNIQGKLTQGSTTIICPDNVVFDRAEQLDLDFAKAALYGIFLLIVTLGLIYAGSPILMLTSATAGVIVVFVMGGFIFNSWIPIVSIAIFISLIVLIGRYTRK